MRKLTLIILGIFVSVNSFASTLTYTDGAESPSTLIRSTHWNNVKSDIQTFLDSNLLDSNDNIKAGGISTTALANLAVTDAKIAGITTAGKVNGSALTSLSSIPSGAGVIPAANVPAVASTNYRSGLSLSQASSTTMTLTAGIAEVNNSQVVKTGATTLDITSAGTWAGGVSLQAVSTYGFVLIDASGNIKLTTTAPTNNDYALAFTTGGIKRYASVSSTTYRYLGWFYMNSTGSGQLNSWEVGNFKDGDVPNAQIVQLATDITTSSASMVLMTGMQIHFYTCGRPLQATYSAPHYKNGTGIEMEINIDSSSKTLSWGYSSDTQISFIGANYLYTPAQGTRNCLINWEIASGTGYQRGSTDGQRVFTVNEL